MEAKQLRPWHFRPIAATRLLRTCLLNCHPEPRSGEGSKAVSYMMDAILRLTRPRMKFAGYFQRRLRVNAAFSPIHWALLTSPHNNHAGHGSVRRGRLIPHPNPLFVG